MSDTLTLKMFNYALMSIIGVYYLLKYKRINTNILSIVFLYTLILLIGIILSFANNGTNNLFNDLSPLLYMYTIIYFDFTIKDDEYIVLVKRLVQFCSVSLAIIYLIYLLLVYFGILDNSLSYIFFSAKTEVMFRNGGPELFYAGFLYLIIGLCFYIVDNKLFSAQTILLLLAIYFTKTRGFYVIALLAYLLFFAYKFKESKYKFKIHQLILFLSFTLISIYFLFSYRDLLIDSNNHDDQIRFDQTKQVIERIDISSIFFGHGLGVGVPIRKRHMENSFLEILHKQGLIGLSFWTFLLITSLINFGKISKQKKNNALPFMLSILLIYIQSLFNPFVNNPIGMSFVIISYIIILKLRKTHENKCLHGYLQR